MNRVTQEYRIEKYPPYLQLKIALDSLMGIPVRVVIFFGGGYISITSL